MSQDGTLLGGFSYDHAAGTITQTHGNSLYSQTATDALWRVTQVSSTLADYNYGYDDNGNRTFMQRAHQSGAPYELYQYDSLNQLTEVWTGADAADPEELTDYEQHQGYELDPLGNRLTLDADGSQIEYQPSNGQRLSNPMNRYEQAGEAELSYDDIGNLLSDGANAYTYDVLNRQISVTTLDSSAEYVYDALGRRVAKVVDGVTTYYLYNAGTQVIEERDSDDELQARYSYGSGIDEPLSMERDGSVYYYHRDGLGSVTEVSDQSGNLVERYEYDVYGAPTIFDSTETELTASAIGNPYLFTGRLFDPESGNYYYRARIYSPDLGRFLQTDPLGYVDGLNLYAYVGNNPATWVDPDGLMSETQKKWTLVGAGTGAAAGAYMGGVAGATGGPAAPVTIPGGAYGGSVIGGAVGGAAGYAIGSTIDAVDWLLDRLWWPTPPTVLPGDGETFPPLDDIDDVCPLYLPYPGFPVTVDDVPPFPALPQEPVLETFPADGPIEPSIYDAAAPPLAGILEGHEAGQGFSTVYDEVTGNLLLKPSKRGPVPEGWVPRRGGHAQVSAELGGDASSHHGLAVILQEDGTLAITWRSGQLNRGPNNLVPTNIRPNIVEAVETLTGRTVSSY